MSNELKRTFLAGALIAGILFVAQILGVFEPQEEASSVPAAQADILDNGGETDFKEPLSSHLGLGLWDGNLVGCESSGGFYDAPSNKCGPLVLGCTDKDFENFNSNANTDDGSCSNIKLEGCLDSNASNFSATATEDDGSCKYYTVGFVGPVSKFVLSSFSGGSFLEYHLIEKNLRSEYQYLGFWEDGQAYNNTDPINLILDKSNVGCAPCVSITTNSKTAVLRVGFSPEDQFSLGQKSRTLSSSASFNFTYETNQYLVTKSVSLHPDSYVSNHQVSITNKDGEKRSVGLVWDKGLAYTEKLIGDDLSTYVAAYAGVENSYEEFKFNSEDDNKITYPITGDGENYNIDWTTIRNKYFTVAFVPSEPLNRVDFSHTEILVAGKDVPVFSMALNSDGSSLVSDVYIGPLDKDHVANLSYMMKTMNFGSWIINPVSHGILWLLKALGPKGLGLPYGLVLILFAFIVRLITGPLTKRSHKSTQAMQKIQPKIKKLQEQFKGEPQKLNQEMVKLYKEKGVNPLGGCLPMLIQMPLLFALFIIFRSTIELRGVRFLWIQDLANPDVITPDVINSFLASIPGISFFYGHGIALLPIIVGVTMIMSQRINAATMDKKQKPMMLIMAVFFFLLFNKFPAGLNLYYAVYNILNYIQQRSIKKAQ